MSRIIDLQRLIEMQGKAFHKQLPAVYVQLTKFTQKEDFLLVVNYEFVLLHVTFVQKNVWLLIFSMKPFSFSSQRKILSQSLMSLKYISFLINLITTLMTKKYKNKENKEENRHLPSLAC